VQQSELRALISAASPDKRRAPGGNKNYLLKELRSLHFEISRLAALGHKNVDIAQILQIDPQTVSNALNTPLVMRQVARLQKRRNEVVANNDAAQEINSMVSDALTALKEVVNDREEKSIGARLSAANSILDRSYLGPVIKDIRVRKDPPIQKYLDELLERATAAGIIEEAEIVEEVNDKNKISREAVTNLSETN
jgi:formate dehydrogenase maturation protein FdhE